MFFYGKSDTFLQDINIKHKAKTDMKILQFYLKASSDLPKGFVKEPMEFKWQAFCGILLMQITCRPADGQNVMITSHMASLHAPLELKCATEKQEWQQKFKACHSFALISPKSLDGCQIILYHRMLLAVLVKANTASLTFILQIWMISYIVGLTLKETRIITKDQYIRDLRAGQWAATQNTLATT